MTEETLEKIYPWLSSYSPSSREISLPKHVKEAGKPSELWTVQIPRGVSVELLQSSRWEKNSDQDMDARWRTTIDGDTYFLEEVIMNTPCYAVNQDGSALMNPVTRQLVIFTGDYRSLDRDGGQPHSPKAEDSKKKKRKK